MASVNPFLSLSDDLICIIDEFGRILGVNNNWKKAFQSSQPSANLNDFIEQESGREHLRHYLSSAEMGTMKIKSCRIRVPNGRLWVDLRIKRIPSQNKFWCLLKDVSNKKFSNSVLDNIAEACQIGYWKYHSGSPSMEMSDKGLEIFHKTPGVSRANIDEFRNFLPDETLLELQMLRTAHFDMTFSTKINGHDKWIRIKGKKEVFSDNSYEYHGIIQDVTRDVLKEEVHLSSNIELSSFEKGLDQFSIVARTDAKGKIIAANKEFCRLSKYTEEELIGKDHRIVNSGHHPKSFFADMWKCIREGKNWRGEIKNRAKDGSYYWVDTIIIPIRNSNEELVEILSFRFEITQHKKVEEEKRILEEQLSLLNHSQSSLAWSFDFHEKKFGWNSKLHELFNCSYDSTFDDLLKKMEVCDQEAIHAFLTDARQTHFIRNVMVEGKEIQLSFKAIRAKSGETLKVEGICSVISPGSSIRTGILASA